MLLRFCLTKYNWKCKARILFIFKLHCLVLIAGYNSNIFQGCKISVFVRGAILRALFLLSTTCWELLQDRMQHLEHKSDNWFLSPWIELNLCLFFHFFHFHLFFFNRKYWQVGLCRCIVIQSLCVCVVWVATCVWSWTWRVNEAPPTRTTSNCRLCTTSSQTARVFASSRSRATSSVARYQSVRCLDPVTVHTHTHV